MLLRAFRHRMSPNPTKPTAVTSMLAGVIVLCLLLGAGTLAAQETVRFCFNAWKPYIFVENGQPMGLSIAVLKEAARRAGYQPQFTELPWKRCLHLVETGEQDAAIGAAQRTQFLQGPTSYSVYTNTFWVREAEPIETFSLEALRGRTVGLISGYVYPDELVDNPPYAIDYSIDDDMNLRKLAGGRVDAIVGDLVSTLRIAQSLGLSLRPLHPSHSLDRLYPSFNGEREEMHQRIDKALREMIDDGYIENVYRNMLGLDYRTVLGISRQTDNQ